MVRPVPPSTRELEEVYTPMLASEVLWEKRGERMHMNLAKQQQQQQKRPTLLHLPIIAGGCIKPEAPK
jgi:hypothetical protein